MLGARAGGDTNPEAFEDDREGFIFMRVFEGGDAGYRRAFIGGIL